MPVPQPNDTTSTDVVANIDTTGVNPGPHSKLEGVTTVFDVDREANGYDEERDITPEERWGEKAAGAGTEEYQEDNQPEEYEEVGSDDPYPPRGETLDTSGTDIAASANGREDDDRADQTDQVDTSSTGGYPDQSHVEAATSLVEPASSTALTSDIPKTDANDVQDTYASATSEGHVVQRQGLVKLKVTELLELAKLRGITVKPGTDKKEIINALVQRGVKASEAPANTDDEPEESEPESDTDTGNTDTTDTDPKA